LVFAYVHATSSEGVIEWFIEQVKNGYAIGTVLLCTLAMSLVEIKWAEEFAKLQKQNMTNTKLV
jgi:spore maturation protein SpmB